MVWIFGTLGEGIRKANIVLVGKCDVIIDYCFCYTRWGSCEHGDEHRAL
jgi:hypothetical protein